ncbi:Centromere protein V [Linum perenne]
MKSSSPHSLKSLISNQVLSISLTIHRLRLPRRRLKTVDFWQERNSGESLNSARLTSICFVLVRRHVPAAAMDQELVNHNGGCHCGKIRWRVQAPSSVVAWNCNCSDCSMRGNVHFIVPSHSFELLGDSQSYITTYTFGTHTAKHTFCKVCGITSFYVPRSNPDGVAVTYRCVDPGTLTHVEIKDFDGKNWASSYSQTGIASCSKDPTS